MGELNISEIDLYELFEIEIESSTNEIKKAYRKKALQCHPDKNPGDPNAVHKFHELSRALEILTDATARVAYDKVLKGRKQAVIRHAQLDSKRQKLKEDLEKRENQIDSTQKSADAKLREEIERLRQEGSKAVEEEIQYVLHKVKESVNQSKGSDKSIFRLKLKWSASKNDSSNGGYSAEIIHRFLSKYGDLQAVVMSPKKKGSALVEFKTRQAAEMAVDCEIGLSSNPLKFQWIDSCPRANIPNVSLIKDSDFESITLTKLRQEEERKRLIAAMLAEDEKEDHN